jgi:hypothetical protein
LLLMVTQCLEWFCNGILYVSPPGLRNCKVDILKELMPVIPGWWLEVSICFNPHQ